MWIETANTGIVEYDSEGKSRQFDMDFHLQRIVEQTEMHLAMRVFCSESRKKEEGVQHLLDQL